MLYFKGKEYVLKPCIGKPRAYDFIEDIGEKEKRIIRVPSLKLTLFRTFQYIFPLQTDIEHFGHAGDVIMKHCGIFEA